MDIDKIISKANQYLNSLEVEIIKRHQKPRYPVIFIVGTPRSGTTLLLQLIINNFKIGYINNLIAKFWDAPAIGAAIYHGLSITKSELSYDSKFGFTDSISGPHEFGYFWRRYFHYGETHQLTKDQKTDIKSSELLSEVATLENIFNAPMLFKNPAALCLQIDYLREVFERSIFVHIKRDPIYNAQSLLECRMKYHGSKTKWFSVKPIQYNDLKNKSYEIQIAGQLYFVLNKIESDLSGLDENRKLSISYNELCSKPNNIVKKFDGIITANNLKLERKKNAKITNFLSTDKLTIDQNEFERLQNALSLFF